MAPAISSAPLSPRKPPGTPQAFVSTPSRFGVAMGAPDSTGAGYQLGAVASSHPVEVVGRVRQHPEGKDESALQVFDGKRIRVKMEQGGSREFSLDGVSLAEREDLLEFYAKYVEARVDDVKGGGRCTVMMYGPTGAGKSHTMFGSSSEKGIAYLALRNIMDPNTYGPHGCGPVTVRASIIEIYNEEIFDLLGSTGNAPGLPKNVLVPRVKLEVMGKKLQKATWITGNEHNKLFLQITKTEKSRVIKSTNCNDRSSRSHCVVILEVPAVGGRLVLVDMAGSENVEQAGIGSEARLQTGKINQGNGALKRVVEAIANGHEHIPYRDSKLTMILQDSFEDDGARILMILCASPDLRDIYKTLGTLEYGAKAKCIVRLPNSPPKDKVTAGSDQELLAKVRFKDACIEKLRLTQEQKDRAIEQRDRLVQEKEAETRRLRMQIEEMERQKSMGYDLQFELKVKVDQLRKELRLELERELESKLEEARWRAEEEGRRKIQEMEKELQRQQMTINYMSLRAEKAEGEVRRLKSVFAEGDAFDLVPPPVEKRALPEVQIPGFSLQDLIKKEESGLQDVSPSSISLVSQAQRAAAEPSRSPFEEAGPSGSPEYDRGSEHDTSGEEEDDERLPALEGCASPAVPALDRTPRNSTKVDILSRLSERVSARLRDDGNEQSIKAPLSSPEGHPGMFAENGEHDGARPGSDKQTSSPITRNLFVKREENDDDDDLFAWSGASLHTKGWLPIIHEEREEEEAEEDMDTGSSRTPGADHARDVVGRTFGSTGEDSFLQQPLFPSNLNRDKFMGLPHPRTEIRVKQEADDEASKLYSLNQADSSADHFRGTCRDEKVGQSWRPTPPWPGTDVSATITDSLRATVESRSPVVKEQAESTSGCPSPIRDSSGRSVLESIMDSLHDVRMEVQEEKGRVGGATGVIRGPTADSRLAIGGSSLAQNDEESRAAAGGMSRTAEERTSEGRRGGDSLEPASPIRTPSSTGKELAIASEGRSASANRRARIESIFLLCGETRQRKELASRGTSEGVRAGEDGIKPGDGSARTPAESKPSRVSEVKASPRRSSPPASDDKSPAARTGVRGLELSPGPSALPSPAGSPLKTSPLKSKKLLSLSGNLFRLPNKGSDHKPSSGISKVRPEKSTPEQVESNGTGRHPSNEEGVANDNESSRSMAAEKCQVFVKWEASKETTRKLIHMVTISKGASLADLRKEIEPHIPETKHDFSFLFMNGEPSGAPVEREMEASLRVASLPDCNNNRSSRLACLRPPASQASALAYKSIFPFQPLENKIDLDNSSSNMGKTASSVKSGTKSAAAKTGHWTGPPVVPQMKGLRTLATGFGIRPVSEGKAQGRPNILLTQR